MKPKITEKQVQSSIISFLNTRRILHNRINNGQFVIKENGVDKYGRNRRKSRAVRCNSINGIPDIEVFAGIMFQNNIKIQIPIYLEVKSPTGKQSKDQKLFQSRIVENGGFYYVVRSIDDVINSFEITEKHIKSILSGELYFLKSYSMAEKAKK